MLFRSFASPEYHLKHSLGNLVLQNMRQEGVESRSLITFYTLLIEGQANLTPLYNILLANLSLNERLFYRQQHRSRETAT
jgi:hypothetical protein